MKTDIIKCPICSKKHKIKKWIAKEGLLKGQTIVSNIICSKKCKRRFELLMRLSDILEELENE